MAAAHLGGRVPRSARRAATILIGAIFVAVAVGIAVIELRRDQYLWMLASFVAALILISLIHAGVAPDTRPGWWPAHGGAGVAVCGGEHGLPISDRVVRFPARLGRSPAHDNDPMDPEENPPMPSQPRPASEAVPTVHPATLGEPREHLTTLERLLDPQRRLTATTGDPLVPAWRRVTTGEARWPVSIAMVAAIGLQVALPERLNLSSRFLLPAIEAVLLVVLVAVNPRRIDRASRPLRLLGLVLIAVASLANAYSAARLVIGLVNGTEGEAAGPLLSTGAAIYLTNILVFALWYWELDRGGPAARALAARTDPDFLFPQMASPHIANPHWEPGFADYLYVSFTNATAFSPTDTMPLTRWAKMIMLLQSAISLVTVALVVARAVNILK